MPAHSHPADLIGHWPFGKNLDNQSATPLQTVNHNVVLAPSPGNPQWRGAQFNGLDSYLKIPNHPALDWGTGDFTLSVALPKTNRATCSGSIAGKADLSATSVIRAQFPRQFRRIAGHSFLEHLTALRLERAKVLLRETDWNIELVARAVGLRPAHLWDLFAKRLNITPGEFRRSAVGSKLPPRHRKALVAAESSFLHEPQRELNR